jgi:small subunit ribosomal protein S3
MGQKVNPNGLRLTINRTWDSRWFADGGDYAKRLHEDIKIRKLITTKLKDAELAKVIIERSANKMRVTLYSSKPGVIIGKKGADIDKIKQQIAKMTSDEVVLNIVEIRKPEISAPLVAQNVASQLERRISFRRAMKRVMQSAMRMGALGIRVNCSGRLGGAEIARTEWYREGRVPLHTLRADVDYATAEATTPYGILGVKVWIYKGDVMIRDPLAADKRLTGAMR